MGIFNRNPEKVAERKRRKARRLDAKASGAEAQAAAWDTSEVENATMEGTNAKGQRVTQEVRIRKKGSKQRNQRLATIEKQLAALSPKVDNLEEENEELRSDLAEWEKGRMRTSALFGTTSMALAETFISIINVNDVVQQPAMLAFGEALEGAANADLIDNDQKVWARAGAVFLKGWAYYKPNEGLMSILQGDQSPTFQRVNTAEGAAAGPGNV